MRNLLLTSLAALFAVYASAQACLPTEITLSSYMNENGPAWYAWDIVGDNNEMFASGIAQFTPQLPNYPASACLPPGCYTLTAVAMTVIQPGSTFASFDPAGGYWSDYEVSYDGMAMTMVFCIAENQPCEIEVAVLEEQTCSMFNLVATTPNTGAQIYWSINGEPYTTGGFFSWEASNPGSYQICASFETPDCPEGVFWCETFVVSPECFENDCPYDFVITQQDCWSIFYLSGANDGDVMYYVNGEPVSNGELAYTHWFGTNGSFEVCAVYEGICDQTEFCQTVVVTDCDDVNPCTIDFEVLPLVNCGGYIIFPVNYPVGAQVFIEVNGDVIASGANDVVFVPETTGNYEVCVYFESGACNELIQACEVVNMTACTNDCEMVLNMNQVNCGEFVFDVQVESGWQDIFWTINGEPYGFLAWNQTIQFTQDGIYEICATYENAQCGFQQVCTSVTVANCLQGCTEFSLSLFSQVNQNGPTYVLYGITDAEENVVDAGEAFFNNDTLMQVLDFCLPAGCYTIALSAPNGGLTGSFDWLFQGALNQYTYDLVEFTDQMMVFEVCLEPTLVWPSEDDCFLEVYYTLNEDGNYVISAEGPNTAEIKWSVNGSPEGIANEWVFEPEWPGVYEICAYYDNVCFGLVETCFTLAGVDSDECTPVVMHISTANDVINSAVISTFIESLELEIGFDVNYYEFDASTTLGICLPDGCYDITLGLTEFLVADLLINIEIDGEPTVDYQFDLENQEVTIQLAVNTDCSIGVDEVGQTGELNLFPHPADQAVNLTHTFTGAVNVQIFDLNGRMVAAFDQLAGNTLQLPTHALSQGLYIVQVGDGNYVKQAKMQIQR
jgi:hypothetical protein